MPISPPPMSGKYARLEIERRYLLDLLPLDLGAGWHITDRYITGTRLRLRRMEARSGKNVICKLGQKFATPEMHPGAASMTTMYLNPAEYERLAALDAAEIRKTRHGYAHSGRQYGIDRFEGDLTGLVLAETECETIEEFNALETPPFAVADVTFEPFFTGGALARLTADEFQARYNRWLEVQHGPTHR